jgi:hypothetical protein
VPLVKEPVAEPVVTVEPDRGWRSRQPWLKVAAGAVVIAVVALATAVAYRWHRPQRSQGQEALTVFPFTALPGQETAPALSPDAPESLSRGTVIPHPGPKASIYM